MLKENAEYLVSGVGQKLVKILLEVILAPSDPSIREAGVCDS